MKSTTKRAYALYALVAFFMAGIIFFVSTLTINASDWALSRYNKHIYDGNTLNVAGSIFDSKGELLVGTQDGKRVYNESAAVRKATLHAIGDSDGYISTGIQSVYSDELIGYNFINGIYSISKFGTGNNIRLTLDSDVCVTALNALNGRKGTVGVYNYKTGEIICMVSSPTYDPENKPTEAIEKNANGKYDGIYLNRFLSGVYTPGSVFKAITCVSAVNNISDIFSQTFYCDGSIDIPGGGEVKCSGVHGTVTFKDAFAHSCNCAFATIANELGADALAETANELGFNRSFKMGDTVIAKSSFDVSSVNNTDLAWAGIGQYTTLLNPYHMMMIMGAIANSGNPASPYVVKSIETPDGKVIDEAKTQNVGQLIEPATADIVRDMMRYNVTSYYKDWRFPGLELAGKTGTAELDGNQESHAWFTGFSTKEDCPLAFVVIVENGGAGFSQAMPIANTVMQAAYKSISE